MIGKFKGGKLSGAALVAVACLSVAAAVGPDAAFAKPAATKLTIQVRSDKLVGFVSSPDPERCAAGRRIVVFERLGDAPSPGSDKRIAAVRASRKGAYRWSAATPRPGRFYAQAPGRPGCAAALSRSVRSTVGAEPPSLQPPAAGERTDYPPCGPYVNEGTSFICKFEQLHLDLEGVGAFSKCRFGDDSSACQGVATNGLFPWGKTFSSRGRPKVKIAWSWNGSSRNLTVVTYRDDQGDTGVANLTGTVPNAGSPRFTVTEAFAQSGDGYPNGNHFYTPNLPGQGPGEPGGPLAINFQNGSGTDWGAVADIWGYLYLKR